MKWPSLGNPMPAGARPPRTWLLFAWLVLLGSSDRRWRDISARALARSGDARAIPALLPGLLDAAPHVRRSTEAALERLGWRPSSPVECVLSAAARGDWDTVQSVGPEGAPALAHLFCRGEDLLRERAALHLRGLGAEGVAVLAQVLADPAAPHRVEVAAALGLLDAKDALAVLAAALRDPEWGVCVAAAQALVVIGPEAVEPLIRALRQRDWAVRQLAAEALGVLGDPRAVAPLLAALGTHDRGVRRAVARALGALGEKRAVDRLLAAGRDEDPRVRRAAAEALGRIGEARATRGLLVLLDDADWDVRAAAAEALGRVGQRSALLPLREHLSRTGRRLEEDPAVTYAIQQAILAIQARGVALRDLPLPFSVAAPEAERLPIPACEPGNRNAS